MRPSPTDDVTAIQAVINAAAEGYRGVIPTECWHEPYMPEDELRNEMAAGVGFLGWQEGGRLVGVMGLQEVKDVALIRHAYVVPEKQRRGVGAQLLVAILEGVERPVLVGTWAAATWAISFYRKHGFEQVSRRETERLLKTYWSVPDRQIATSVVLAGQAWQRRQTQPCL